MILALVLVIINIFIYMNTREPENLRIVKEKYRILREHLKETNNEEFEMLQKPIPITAHTRTDTIGYNTNKGQEIGLCIDGDTNKIMHVLIHELTHSTIKEYDHSDKYWDKYNKLIQICKELGIYEPITQKTKFCGKHVQDK